jgi:hypothetical protein
MLRLVPPAPSSSRRDVQAYDLRPHDLVARPQRPGELTVAVVVALDGGARPHVSAHARDAGVPAALWLAVALEAQRSIEQATSLLGGHPDRLAVTLDAEASKLTATDVDVHYSPALIQLRSYASALRAAGTPASEPLVGRSLPLFPALHVAAAWALDAQRDGLEVAAWASERTAALPIGRMDWEAASAAHGQTLAEWVLAQAVRCARSCSTSAHSAARG